MAVLHNRLLLPEEGIASKIIKGDEDALRLVKPTGAGSLGGTIAPPLLDGGRPAWRAPRAGFRVPCSLVGVCILREWPMDACRCA